MSEKKTIDPYKWQKEYYKRNKKKLNQYRVLLNYRKKYPFIDSHDKLKKFKEHKQTYLKLKLLDMDLVNEFLKH